jgi:hypothetical protein
MVQIAPSLKDVNRLSTNEGSLVQGYRDVYPVTTSHNQ